MSAYYSVNHKAWLLDTDNSLTSGIAEASTTTGSVSSSASAVMDELVDYGIFRGPSVLVGKALLSLLSSIIIDTFTFPELAFDCMHCHITA